MGSDTKYQHPSIGSSNNFSTQITMLTRCSPKTRRVSSSCHDDLSSIWAMKIKMQTSKLYIHFLMTKACHGNSNTRSLLSTCNTFSVDHVFVFLKPKLLISIILNVFVLFSGECWQGHFWVRHFWTCLTVLRVFFCCFFVCSDRRPSYEAYNNVIQYCDFRHL